jgi:hypothetical protein
MIAKIMKALSPELQEKIVETRKLEDSADTTINTRSRGDGPAAEQTVHVGILMDATASAVVSIRDKDNTALQLA